jgi:WD40 repeat protein
VLPYKTYTIKSIQRPAGTFLKQLDPVVMTVQSLERLLAEASIEEQYFTRFKDQKHVTATIEPTVLEAPTHEWHGHDADVTCVAVAKDLKIVSGSEDRSVCVWKPNEAHVQRKYEHGDAVKAIACTPANAKRNLCIVGCADGDIWLWDLDAKETDKPLVRLEKPHGLDITITALAFSPNGEYFASGGSDGSIRLWTTASESGKYGEEKYAFVPEKGVGQTHEEAVTSLHFTPQSRLVSAARDKTLKVWKLRELGACLDGNALRNRDGNVRSLGVSEDGSYMLFDQGRTLRFLSVENHNMIHSINLPPNSVPFDTLALLSPDGSLMLTAGAPEGRLQLWRTPTAEDRGFEVRTFAPRERDRTVACAAFSPHVASNETAPFAVSGSGQKIFLWSLPTPTEVKDHRIINVPLTIKSQVLDPVSRTARIGFEVANPATARYPNGRFEAGRPLTIVID